MEFTRSTGLLTLPRHRGVEGRFVDIELALTAHVGCQVEREAIGIVQLERGLTIQYAAFRQAGQCTVQNFHAMGDRFEETFFLQAQNIGHAVFGARQFRIGIAHFGNQR